MTVEYDSSVDTGCELHPSCLNCPFEVCKEDVGRGTYPRPDPCVRESGSVERNRRIAALFFAGVSIAKLSKAYGLNQSSIYDILRKERERASRRRDECTREGNVG